MKLVPLDEMTPEQWYRAWKTMFDPAMAEHVGISPEILAAKPHLEDFYSNIMGAYQQGRYRAWAIIGSGGDFKGYTLLDRTVGEWEITTVLLDPQDWGRGLGARASLRAGRWAFEEDNAEWVVAFTQGKDPTVADQLKRGGFRPLMNFLVMDRATWNARWRARSK